MTLKYTQDIDCIIPKSISFNYAEMESELSSMLCECQCDVNEENIKERKELRARINKLVSAFKTERTSMKKKFLAPLEDFNKKIDTLVGNCEIVLNILDDGIKKVEDERRNAKLRQARSMMMDRVNSDFNDFIITQPESWDEWFDEQKHFGNVTCSMLDISKEIEVKVSAVRADITALSAAYKGELYAKSKLVYSRLGFDIQRTIAEMSQFIAEQNVISNAIMPPPSDPTASLHEKWTVGMRITGTMEQMKMLSQYMKDNGIQFSVTEQMSKVK